MHAGCVPGAVRIPRHMLLLRSQGLMQDGSHIVAYGATESKSMLVRLLPPQILGCLGIRTWLDDEQL